MLHPSGTRAGWLATDGRDVEPWAGVGSLDRHARQFPTFSGEQCGELFEAILIDDRLDPDACLPESIQLVYSRGQLIDCFALCRQLWREDYSRDELLGLAETIIRDRALDEADRCRLKHIRAKFKHFRYAHALYGKQHRYPLMLDLITSTMGRVQDAIGNGWSSVARLHATMLRSLLTPPPDRLLEREANSLRLTTPASFRALLQHDVEVLEQLVRRRSVTGHAFHKARKHVGRQVSFWDTLRTLSPTSDRFRMSRSLSAINGLMGEHHDELVRSRMARRGSYSAGFVLPEPIRERICLFVERFSELTTSPSAPHPAGARY